MQKVASVELRSDGDHLYARPVFHAGWTRLHGTTRPGSGWVTLPIDPAAAVLRHELEELLAETIRQIGAAWEYELVSGRSRMLSDHHHDPQHQADDDQETQ